MDRRDEKWLAGVEAVRRAGRVCKKVQDELGRDGVLAKEDRSPVTVADFASQAVVCATLGSRLTDVEVVAEEGSAQLRRPESTSVREQVVALVAAELGGASGRDVLGWIDRGDGEPGPKSFWTLDPIDGTKGFLRGDHYAVALALIEGGEVTFGALACPNLSWEPGLSRGDGILLAASPEAGCWMEPLGTEARDGRSSDTKEIRASALSSLSEGRFCESVEPAHTDQELSQSIAREAGLSTKPFRIDSQCKYAVVARGEASVYLRVPKGASYREKIWDHAAGMTVVESAGGRVTDLDGRNLDFTRGKRLTGNRGVVATSGGVHDRVLEAIRKLSV